METVQPIFETEKGGKNVLACIDNIMDVVATETPDMTPFVILGGGASAALAAKGTQVDVSNGLVLPPRDLYKPQYRENGSLTDCDILLFDTDSAAVTALRRALTPNPYKIQSGTEAEITHEEAKPGNHLKIGVTPLTSLDAYERQSRVTKDFVSHRVEYPNGTRRFQIFNVSILLPDEYFEPWQQELPSGKHIPIMHPVIQMANYGSRACHGVRHRDVEKLQKMHANIGHVFGMEVDWVQDMRHVNIRVNKQWSANPAVEAALEFLAKKNELDFRQTRQTTGTLRSAAFAIKKALHRPADKYLEKLGQEGWLFDHVLSRSTGEDQTKLYADEQTA